MVDDMNLSSMVYFRRSARLHDFGTNKEYKPVSFSACVSYPRSVPQNVVLVKAVCAASAQCDMSPQHC